MSKESAAVLAAKQCKRNRSILFSAVAALLAFWLLLFFRELLITAPVGSQANGLSETANVGVWKANNVMVYVALLHLFVAVFAVWLIYRNLSETRKVLVEAERTTEAALETVKAAQKAERALLIPEFRGSIQTSGIVGPHWSPTHNTGDVYHLRVIVNTLLHNVGRTVALYTQPYFASVKIVSNGFKGTGPPQELSCTFEAAIKQNKYTALPQLIMVGDFDAAKLVNEGPILTVGINADFEDAFGVKRTLETISEFSFSITKVTGATTSGETLAIHNGADSLQIKTKIISQD